MIIVDCHGHVFPPLSGACGFKSEALHRLYMQRAMHTHGNQPVVRSRDGAVMSDKHLWAADDPSESGRIAGLKFRADGHGRFAWEHEGETYHIQFLPPSMAEMASPAETVIAQMDHAGIDAMVLQNDHIYGNSAGIFAGAVERFPDRFIGLAQVEEAFAWREDEIQRVVEQVEGQDMRGLYFTLAGFFRSGWGTHYTDSSYDRFWAAVRRLRLPVFWVFPAQTPWGSFVEEMQRFKLWLEAWPDIKSVIVHGWPTGLFANETDLIEWPDIVVHIQQEHEVYPEILYPIGWGGREEYPYPRALHHIRQIYDRFGAERFMWGSDMPNVERNCTYPQSLNYLYSRCDWMNESERASLFAGTALSLFPTRVH